MIKRGDGRKDLGNCTIVFWFLHSLCPCIHPLINRASPEDLLRTYKDVLSRKGDKIVLPGFSLPDDELLYVNVLYKPGSIGPLL